MKNLVKGFWRKEDGADVLYSIHNESYEDDYGCLVENFVPYRTAAHRKRLSPSTMALSYMEAERYITFGEWHKCHHCGSTYFQRESDRTPSATSSQPV